MKTLIQEQEKEFITVRRDLLVMKFINILILDYIKQNEITKKEFFQSRESVLSDIVPTRFALSYLMYTETSKSLKFCGRFLGGKDHSTIINAKKVIENALENEFSNPVFAKKYKEIKKRFDDYINPF